MIRHHTTQTTKTKKQKKKKKKKDNGRKLSMSVFNNGMPEKKYNFGKSAINI